MIILIILFQVSIIFFLPFGNVHLTAKTGHLIAQGDSFYFQCDNEQALRAYEKAYSIEPWNYDVLVRLVRIHNDNGYINLSNKEIAKEEYIKAIHYADTLLKYYPDSASSHILFALAKGSLIPFVGVREKIETGKIARFHIQKAIELDSLCTYAYILNGIFERELSGVGWLERQLVRLIFNTDLRGSLQNSEASLWKALSIEPMNLFAYYELYWTFIASGNVRKARSMLEQLLTIPARTMREKKVHDTIRQLYSKLSIQ